MTANDVAREPGQVLEHLFRREAGRIVARLTHLLGPANVGLAEDAMQEALLRALRSWPTTGTPDNPACWLFRVAHNLAMDAVRRDRSFGEKTPGILDELQRTAECQAGMDPQLEARIRDDELRMIFMCCHPAMSRDASVALSLKTIGGLSVREIARAFLCDEATIAQRIVRAKRLIRSRGLTLELPHGTELPARLDAVLDVIYFMFNEGYATHTGAELIREELCLEALRLGRLIADAADPALAAPRTHALVALMALQAARFPARVDAAGDLILLEDQDRSLWDQRLIALGCLHFDLSIAGDDVSGYHVQAAIAAAHAAPVTDWPLVLQLYDQLLSLNASPVVALNRAVAVAKVHGPAAALALLEPLEEDPRLREYHLLLALRGQILLDLQRPEEAAECFRSALDCQCSEPERRFLAHQLESCERP